MFHDRRRDDFIICIWEKLKEGEKNRKKEKGEQWISCCVNAALQASGEGCTREEAGMRKGGSAACFMAGLAHSAG